MAVTGIAAFGIVRHHHHHQTSIWAGEDEEVEDEAPTWIFSVKQNKKNSGVFDRTIGARLCSPATLQVQGSIVRVYEVEQPVKSS